MEVQLTFEHVQNEMSRIFVRDLLFALQYTGALTPALQSHNELKQPRRRRRGSLAHTLQGHIAAQLTLQLHFAERTRPGVVRRGPHLWPRSAGGLPAGGGGLGAGGWGGKYRARRCGGVGRVNRVATHWCTAVPSRTFACTSPPAAAASRAPRYSQLLPMLYISRCSSAVK
jgi:hypothetical protein